MQFYNLILIFIKLAVHPVLTIHQKVALCERITAVRLLASAHRGVTDYVALGIATAGIYARISASLIDTG